MRVTSTDTLQLKALPLPARTCHKFDKIQLPLVSVPKLCAHGWNVTFDHDTVHVTNDSGDTVLRGHRDPIKNL